MERTPTREARARREYRPSRPLLSDGHVPGCLLGLDKLGPRVGVGRQGGIIWPDLLYCAPSLMLGYAAIQIEAKSITIRRPKNFENTTISREIGGFQRRCRGWFRNGNRGRGRKWCGRRLGATRGGTGPNCDPDHQRAQTVHSGDPVMALTKATNGA